MVEPNCSRAMGPGLIGLSTEPQDEGPGMGCRRESTDHQSLYRDIWTLRASLEQYISSDHSSNNDSVHSDADSVSSLRLRTEKAGMPSYPSQNIGDGIEVDSEIPGDEVLEKRRKQDSIASEKGSDESGTRKLLQMDSGYASIDAPSRAPDEVRLFRSSSGSKEDLGSAMECRHFFTSSDYRGTVCESFDTDILDEDLEEEPEGASGGSDPVMELEEGGLVWSPYGQMFTRSDAQPRVPVLSCRDYSIDEKTDALFHEFLRHDPQFDQQESPVRSKHRSRVHLRKQWQHSKQYSDPGQRFHSSFDRYRTPLRRGETVNYPLESSYHVTLPRIVSGPDEENSNGTANLAELGNLAELDNLPTSTTNQSVEADKTLASPKDDHSKHPSSIDTSGDFKDNAELASYKLPQVIASNLGQREIIAEDTGHTVEPSDGHSLPQPAETGHGPQTITAELRDKLSVTLEDGHSPPQPAETGYGPQTITTELSDKLSVTLEDHLYSDLRRTREQPECLLTATHASPDHSPV